MERRKLACSLLTLLVLSALLILHAPSRQQSQRYIATLGSAASGEAGDKQEAPISPSLVPTLVARAVSNHTAAQPHNTQHEDPHTADPHATYARTIHARLPTQPLPSTMLRSTLPTTPTGGTDALCLLPSPAPPHGRHHPVDGS
jgi:hypothetical protein